jgi:BASS family bile acid:Na+ symporter
MAIGIAVFEQRENLAANFESVGLVMLIFNILSLALGYGALRFFGIARPQAIAGGMEIGIHNGTLAIAIAITVLAKPLVAMPAAVYSILMFITAAIFGYIATRKADLNA